MAQTADSLRLQQLQKDMYRHYSKHETKAFMETTEALKALAKKMGDEKAYYKAWGNQAVYGSTYISRSQAIETAKEILKHAETRKSQYGIYTANYVLGTIYTSLAQLEDASDRYTEALDILKHHYPEESLSALYLAITKIDRALGKHEKVKEYTDYVLADPKARLQHKLSALSYRYMVETDSKAAVEDRDMTYRKREEMKRRLGHDDNFGYIIDFDHALLHDDFDWAQRIVDSLPEGQSKTTKALYRSKLAARKGDWREAYEWQARYKRLYDSTNNDQVKQNSLEMGMALDKAKAENEANALRLAKLEEEAKNREQQTRNKQLEDEAMAMRIALQQAARDGGTTGERQPDGLQQGPADERNGVADGSEGVGRAHRQDAMDSRRRTGRGGDADHDRLCQHQAATAAQAEGGLRQAGGDDGGQGAHRERAEDCAGDTDGDAATRVSSEQATGLLRPDDACEGGRGRPV